MYTFSKLMIAVVAGGTLMAPACSKDDKPAKTSGEPTEKPKATVEPKANTQPVAKPSESEADTSFAADMMKSYEECRALLAADKTAGLSACAEGIVEASQTAHATAPEAAHEHITTLAKAAELLSKAPTDDIEAIRLSFGEVSKSAVAMLTAAPEAAKSYHLFECPMAKGYKRWAQPGPGLENPYKGAKMLTCGSEVHDHHADMKK